MTYLAPEQNGRVAEAAVGAVSTLTPGWLRSVKAAYTTRHVARLLAEDRGEDYQLLQQAEPRAGDVLLARVTLVGRHKRLESPESRRAVLFPGDEILVAYGHRYAPDQFEAEVPPDLRPTHLVAAGGVAGTVTAAHLAMEPPTEIVPMGLLSRGGKVLQLADAAPFRLRPDAEHVNGGVPTMAVVGTSMNSGKSTSLASLANGLTGAGMRVAAGKVTGTGAGGDARLFHDSGANPVVDFTDFGIVSTYRMPPREVRVLLNSMLAELSLGRPDVILIEIADGLGQDETVQLLTHAAATGLFDRVVFSAADALGAHAGVQILRSLGLPVAAVTGRLTASPLAMREAGALLPVEIHPTVRLCEPEVARTVLFGHE